MAPGTPDSSSFNDLTQLYASYSGAELESLAATQDDLTDVAQQALQAEFVRRGLTLPRPLPAPASLRTESPLAGFAAHAPEECVFEFTDLEDALLAQSVLKSAGIESLVPSSEIAVIDSPRLIVAPADASSAQMILSRPNALGTVSPEDAVFSATVCPKCGAPDPVLEAVEPTNEWRCEACNHTWADVELA